MQSPARATALLFQSGVRSTVYGFRFADFADILQGALKPLYTFPFESRMCQRANLVIPEILCTESIQSVTIFSFDWYLHFN